MRLKSYITESNIAGVKAAKKKTETIMRRLYDRLEKYDWEVPSIFDLLDDLTKVSPGHIVFSLGGAKGAIGKYISGGLFDLNTRPPTLEIQLRPGVDLYFKRFKNPKKRKMFVDVQKNAFARELYLTLSHEIIHQIQSIKGGGIPGAYGADITQVDFSQYLSNKAEIDAFAAQAALQAKITNNSWILKNYIDADRDAEIDAKTYQRFLKKFTQYTQELKKMGI